MPLIPYDRAAAVRYAHRWAFGRNPRFYDYQELGGDCTNFASQCLYAGAPFMNYTPDFGWYYIGPNNKAPAWTGVPYFYNFLTRREESRGPVGVPADLEELRPGDFVQLRRHAGQCPGGRPQPGLRFPPPQHLLRPGDAVSPYFRKPERISPMKEKKILAAGEK